MLPETIEVTRGQLDRPALTDERMLAARWLCDGLQAYEADKQAAYDLEVDPGYLSKMRTGEKPVALVHAARLVARKLTAFQAFVASMGVDGSLVVAPLRLEIKLTREQAGMLRRSKEILGPAMWPAFRNEFAVRVFGCDGQMLDVAIDLDARLGK